MSTKRSRLHIRARLPHASGVTVLGSDQRIPGGVLAACALCEQVRQLRLSHVVPKWMYGFMKAEGGIVGRYGSLGVLTHSQDGEKHYLLCDDCEQYLGDAETYLRTFLIGSQSDRERAGIERREDLVEGANMRLIHRFSLGTLLRAHFAPSVPFQSITLDPGLLTRTRAALVSDDYDRLELRTAAIEFHSTVAPINPRGMIFAHWQPDVPLFSLTAVGWQLITVFCADGGATVAASFPPEQFLESGGPWRILTGDITDHRVISPWLYGDPVPEI